MMRLCKLDDVHAVHVCIGETCCICISSTMRAWLVCVSVREQALTVLLEPDPSSLVEQCLAAIREELPAAADKPAEVRAPEREGGGRAEGSPARYREREGRTARLF